MQQNDHFVSMDILKGERVPSYAIEPKNTGIVYIPIPKLVFRMREITGWEGKVRKMVKYAHSILIKRVQNNGIQGHCIYFQMFCRIPHGLVTSAQKRIT